MYRQTQTIGTNGTRQLNTALFSLAQARGTIANMGTETAQQHSFSHLTSQQELFCVGREEKNVVKVGGELAAKGKAEKISLKSGLNVPNC